MKELGDSSPPQWNIRESYSRISKRLQADEETVRLRVIKARDRGFLTTWRMMVNPLLLGSNEANLNLEVAREECKEEAVSKIKRVEGVHGIVDFRGRELGVLMYYENSDILERRVSQIESICESKRIALWNTPFLEPGVQMKQLDWKIIDAMHEDAWRDLDEVAKLLKVTS